MANDRNFEGELTKAISGSLIVGRIVVMAVAIAIASVAVYALGALDGAIKLGAKSQWLFWLKYLIRGIGWILGAYFVLSGMVAVCKMAAARESGASSNIFSGIAGIFANLFVVFFATVRYLFWFVALLIVIWGLGFIGRIPEFGPIISGIALGLVMLAAALWIALHVSKFFVSVLVLPAIMGTSGQKGISCFKESKRILNGQPIRLVKRFLAVGLVVVIYSFVVAQGIGFLGTHGGQALGAKNSPVLNGAPPIKKLPTVPAYAPVPVVTQVQMGTVLGATKATGTRLAGAWIFGIEFMILLVVLKAIGANFFALAGMSTYQALKGEADMPITSPDIKVDLSKIKGSFDGLGAKFKEEMHADEGGAQKKKTAPKKEDE